MADAAWFAGRLRELREEAGLSRKDLAGRAGLSEGGIRDLEQGHRRPSWETVLALTAALGVDCHAFTQEPTADKPGRGRPKKAAEPVPQMDAFEQSQETPEQETPTALPPPAQARPTKKPGRKPRGG